MLKINHNIAIELERQIRRLYKCDRAGVSGLADADNFESNPLDAAKLVVCYIHAKELQRSETQYDEFLHKYEMIFTYPEENDAVNCVDEYVDDITKIVNLYV